MLSLETIRQGDGSLTIAQPSSNFPFAIRRVYYVYDVPSGAERGGHAHRKLLQCLVAVGGSFEVVLNDGTSESRFMLNRPDRGLLIVPGIWRELQNFSSGSVLLVLASEPYAESDYIRSFDEFRRAKS